MSSIKLITVVLAVVCVMYITPSADCKPRRVRSADDGSNLQNQFSDQLDNLKKNWDDLVGKVNTDELSASLSKGWQEFSSKAQDIFKDVKTQLESLQTNQQTPTTP